MQIINDFASVTTATHQYLNTQVQKRPKYKTYHKIASDAEV